MNSGTRIRVGTTRGRLIKIKRILSTVLCVLLVLPFLSQVVLAATGQQDVGVQAGSVPPPGYRYDFAWAAIGVAMGIAWANTVGYFNVTMEAVSEWYDNYSAAAAKRWEVEREARELLLELYPGVQQITSSSQVTEECRLTPYRNGGLLLE